MTITFIVQYWTQKAQEMEGTEMRRADEMRGYALTCLALVLGRLDSRRLETVLEGFESQLFQSLMNQVSRNTRKRSPQRDVCGNFSNTMPLPCETITLFLFLINAAYFVL